MIVLHNFNIDIHAYCKRATSNKFPKLTQCPSCKKKYNIKRHGFYKRYAIQNEITEKIAICRYKCFSCQITISILPFFLIPYFQHTSLIIVKAIYSKLIKKKSLDLSRQLVSFYLKRFTSQSAWISSFFLSILGKTKKNNLKSPIKILILIQELGIHTFHLASFGYQSRYFMSSKPLLSAEST
jgi:hypothetical protein